jgi:hypothetical protein
MAGLSLQRHGFGWAVFGPDGRPVSGVYGDIGLAEVRLEQLADRAEAAARRSRRDCLSCGASFMSEGFHHRLCTMCRSGHPRARHGW